MQILIFTFVFNLLIFSDTSSDLGKKSLKWLVSISAAISFFYLSTMKALLLHVNNMLLISVTHSNVLLTLIRMRGQTPNQHDLMKLNVPKFKHSNAAKRKKTKQNKTKNLVFSGGRNA